MMDRLPKYLVTFHVLPMQMKHMLAQIDTDQRDLVHGALLYRGPNFLSQNGRGDRAGHFIMSADI
ncbi:hypothetical protein WS48_18490 [Burkholderia sp. RF7-non_BP1]|nr:hypothetical protein WS45_05950 [Burkholderia sp. RF2-non_BP3]KUY70178.1 hypothetical protein WS46_32725 [Burkholderia sp. RF4-BP95]KUY92833.1 hypothetical protein WS49_26900 [Burkholderia sp. RF7-non_BP4]KUY95341.1 hypothetical protein WS48_18490 [Burkholderia sp. RF7-non_BP1]